MSYAGRQGDIWRARTSETGRWPNSFGFALEQGLCTEPVKYSALKPSHMSPERPEEEGQLEPAAVGPGTGGIELAEGATEKIGGPWGVGDWDFSERPSFED